MTKCNNCKDKQRCEENKGKAIKVILPDGEIVEGPGIFYVIRSEDETGMKGAIGIAVSGRQYIDIITNLTTQMISVATEGEDLMNTLGIIKEILDELFQSIIYATSHIEAQRISKQSLGGLN